jgi:hypothetical protein
MDLKRLLSLAGKFKGVIAIFGVFPTIIGGVFYTITWLDSNYASAETAAHLKTKISEQEIQQASFEKKLDEINLANKITRLEDLVEETWDKIYELKRRIRIDGVDAREEDQRQLDRLERRIERYERELDRLSPNTE